jgi:plasmid replication initiation protein
MAADRRARVTQHAVRRRIDSAAPVMLEQEDIDALVAALADALVDALAPRVAELVSEKLALTGDRAAARYVDAATLARLFGVERDWVYAHKEKLGAIRLPGGRGERGRLRFDVQRVVAALEELARPATAGQGPKHLSRRRRKATSPPLIEYDEAA